MDARTPNSETSHSHGSRPERCDRIALVLQGGGAVQPLRAANVRIQSPQRLLGHGKGDLRKRGTQKLQSVDRSGLLYAGDGLGVPILAV